MTPAPERKFSTASAVVDGDGRFCGYASLFGRADLSGDVVERGAFTRTLRERGVQGVGMLLEHDPKAPIGQWLLLEEDARGLWVEGRLGGTATAAEAAKLMGEGRIDGLSIGFRTLASQHDRTSKVRRITKIDLWEVSVVMSPMLPEARARAAQAAWEPRAAPADAVDAGLLARMRRTTAFLRQTR
ncbi:MAG: HK97 family phage prohead protease [Pseudomonadota bacterium]